MLYSGLRMIFRFIFTVFFRIKLTGLENIPKEGPVILCSNHKSNWDPPSVATFLNRKVRFMAKEELFRIPLFGHMIKKLGAFPVKRGGISKDSVKRTLDILRQGQVLLIFPEGSRKNKSGIGKKGAASFAVKAKAAVVPVAISGDYKLFGRLKITYGSPMHFDHIESAGDTLELVTEQIMNQIRELERNS